MKWIKLMFFAIVSLVLVVVIAGFVYEQTSRINARKYTVDETFADVGGYKLHYKASGAGEPTVVFESGLDYGGLSAWYKVQPEVAKFVRTFSYDRAGILMSERSDKPKTGDQMARDLYTLLKRTGQSGPYILVGHSMAGVILRSFIDQYSNEVAGIVFVDASHPSQFKESTVGPVLKTLIKPSSPSRWFTVFISNAGFTRLCYGSQYANTYPSTQATDCINRVSKAFLSMSLPAFCSEVNAFESICDWAGQLKDFGNTPLIILTGADMQKRGAGFPDTKTFQAFTKTWMELQSDQLKLSTNSKQILATKSGHYVQLDEPQVVVDAVRELVSKL